MCKIMQGQYHDNYSFQLGTVSTRYLFLDPSDCPVHVDSSALRHFAHVSISKNTSSLLIWTWRRRNTIRVTWALGIAKKPVNSKLDLEFRFFLALDRNRLLAPPHG